MVAIGLIQIVFSVYEPLYRLPSERPPSMDVLLSMLEDLVRASK